jgi:hypothetical protein
MPNLPARWQALVAVLQLPGHLITELQPFLVQLNSTDTPEALLEVGPCLFLHPPSAAVLGTGVGGVGRS